MSLDRIIDRAASGARLSTAEAPALAEANDLAALMRAAAERRDAAHGDLVSYSRKVFIPLTHLCRDVCHYCTFATRPRPGRPAYLSPDEGLSLARPGAAAPPARRWPNSGTRRPSPTSPRCARSSSRRPASCPTPTPA